MAYNYSERQTEGWISYTHSPLRHFLNSHSFRQTK
jgi:hypothetical protein